MARSLFILNSERPAVLRAQFRKLKDDLRDSGLMLDGPYRDQSGAVARISDNVASRMKFGTFANAVGAAIATLAPQNLPSGEPSWLETPFVVTPHCPASVCESAGSAASIETVLMGKQPVRALDMEGLTLLSVAVLRNLGLPAFFSFMHFDQGNPRLMALRSLSRLVGSMPVGDPVPTILAISPEPEFLTLLPPYAISLPTHSAVTGFEVLDDDAVLSLMRLRMAYRLSLELMGKMAHGMQDAWREDFMRAISIGHTLHEGLSLWSMEHARRDLGQAAELLNPRSGSIGMGSVRFHAEAKYANPLISPVHHGIVASTLMLDDEAKAALADLAEQMDGEDPLHAINILKSVRDFECVSRLMAYLRLSDDMRKHVHEKNECPTRRAMN